MIVHLGYVAACTRCGAQCLPGRRSPRAARRAANNAGWPVRDGRRHCPNCVRDQPTHQPTGSPA